MTKKKITVFVIIGIIFNLSALPVKSASAPTSEAYTFVNYLNGKVGE